MPVCAAPPFASEAAASCDERWRAHDLLRLRRLAAFDGEPDWVRDAFERAPYAVVRRAFAAPGLRCRSACAARSGLSGGRRAASTNIVEAISPRRRGVPRNRPDATRAALPAFVAFASCNRMHKAHSTRLSGARPAALVSNSPRETAASIAQSGDLDLLIRHRRRLSRECARATLLSYLQTLARETRIRIDAQTREHQQAASRSPSGPPASHA